MLDLREHKSLYWVFYIDDSLRDEVRDITVRLHEGKVESAQLESVRKHFVHALNGIIDAGFEFYYKKPSELDDSLSPMVQKTVDSIIKTVRGAIHMVVQRVFKRMPVDDLKKMAYYLDSMIIVHDMPSKGWHSSLAFPLDQQLGNHLIEVMNKVEASDHIDHYANELAEFFMRIVKDSVYYYYHRPTEFVSLNRIVKKAADIGMDTTVKGVQKIIKRVIKDVSHKDVVLLSENLQLLVLPADLPYEVCEAVFIEEK